jgi:hypothetical protein
LALLLLVQTNISPLLRITTLKINYYVLLCITTRYYIITMIDPTSCYYYVCISTGHGGKASTPPDSDDDSNRHELDDDQPRDANDDQQFHDNDPIVPKNVVNDQPCPQTGRQKGMAALMNVNPPDMIAKLTVGLKTKTLRIVEDVRSHFAVSAEEQPEGILSKEFVKGI